MIPYEGFKWTPFAESERSSAFVRSIQFCNKHPEEYLSLCVELHRFAFPELFFCHDRGTFWAMIENEGDLFPLQFFNVRSDGRVCLPEYPASLGRGIELFWGSTFNQDIVTSNDRPRFPLNKETGYISFPEWRRMTEEDPGFMTKRFDRAYYASQFEKIPGATK